MKSQEELIEAFEVRSKKALLASNYRRAGEGCPKDMVYDYRETNSLYQAFEMGYLFGRHERRGLNEDSKFSD